MSTTYYVAEYLGKVHERVAGARRYVAAVAYVQGDVVRFPHFTTSMARALGIASEMRAQGLVAEAVPVRTRVAAERTQAQIDRQARGRAKIRVRKLGGAAAANIALCLDPQWFDRVDMTRTLEYAVDYARRAVRAAREAGVSGPAASVDKAEDLVMGRTRSSHERNEMRWIGMEDTQQRCIRCRTLAAPCRRVQD